MRVRGESVLVWICETLIRNICVYVSTYVRVSRIKGIQKYCTLTRVAPLFLRRIRRWRVHIADSVALFQSGGLGAVRALGYIEVSSIVIQKSVKGREGLSEDWVGDKAHVQCDGFDIGTGKDRKAVYTNGRASQAIVGWSNLSCGNAPA